MKSMALTADEAKEYSNPVQAPGDGPKYPYGLCLCLDNDTLEKLGITSLPDVGQVMEIKALATVTSVGMNQEQDGDKRQRADLQITDLELSKSTGDLAERMYGKS